MFSEWIESIDRSTESAPVSKASDELSTISGYHRFELIAQGGMGVVYSATQRKTDRKVAIKCLSLRPGDAYGAERKERLMREAEALTKIDHPNIVRAIEVILISGNPALVMEYVQGEPLHRWIRAHQCEPQLAAQLTLQLAQALAHAHLNGVIHCDLKPHNVIVMDTGQSLELKLIDFGLAKLSDQIWDITQSGDVLGTPAYMAPEQTTGKKIPASVTIDVYGLGTILYELLVGRPQFEDSDSSVLLTKVVRQAPEGPSQIRPEIPKSLECICLKCLEKSPADRYASAELLAQDLQAFLGNRPVLAKAPSLSRKLSRLMAIHRGIALGLTLAGLVGTLSGFALWKESRSKQQIQSGMQLAEQEKRSANTRAQLAQTHALEELRTTLEETAERLFGATPDREDAEWHALDRIAQRWGRHAEQLDDTQEGQLVRAEALMRLGSVHSILTELDQAEAKLRSADKILDPLRNALPNDPRLLTLDSHAQWELGKCFFEQGKVSESDHTFLKALSLGEQAIELDAKSESTVYLLAKIRRDYGVLLTRLGRMTEAQEQLDAAIGAIEGLLSEPKGSVLEDRSSIADLRIHRDRLLEQWWSTRTAQATALKISGNANQAIESIAKIPDELMELQTRRPEDPVIWRLISGHYFTLGICQLDAGRFEECKGSLLEGLKYPRRLVALYPRRQDQRKNQGSYCSTLAVISIRLGQTGQALEYAFEAFGIQSELAKEYPNRPEYLSEKARCMMNLVAILASVQRLEEASLYGIELVNLQSQLCNDYPDQSEYAYGLAASCNIVGQVLTKQGLDIQASAMFQNAREIFSELMLRFPRVAMYRSGMANVGFSIADAAIRKEQWNDAIDAYGITIEVICSHRVASNPNESILLAQAYEGQAIAFERCGDANASRICARLGCETILPWKDRDSKCQAIYRRCQALY